MYVSGLILVTRIRALRYLVPIVQINTGDFQAVGFVRHSSRKLLFLRLFIFEEAFKSNLEG